MTIGKKKLKHSFKAILNLFQNRLFCVALLALLALSACTDYEGVLDDNYEKWKEEIAEIESSANKLSSSVLQSSSSNEIQYGTLTDSRDCQTYKTVTIGSQTWMAENLNYAYNEKTSSLDSSSFCYNNSADSCSKYGRLYLWSAAMDSAAIFRSAGKGCGNGVMCSAAETTRGICPEGWHLPSKNEWSTLFAAVGGISIAGTMLKSTSGWRNSGNGEDFIEFSVLPAGYRNYNGYFYGVGDRSYFWCSNDYDSDDAYDWFFYYDYTNVNEYIRNKNYAFSVRCVKNLNSEEDNIIKSSSSVVKSSSSVVTSSSSNAKSCSSTAMSSSSIAVSSSSIKDGSSYDASAKTLTDLRDDRVYKTVTIGTQTWMAENLNFAYDVPTSTLDSSSFCYNNVPDSCSKYGRLYLWSAAMDSADVFSSAGKGCGYGVSCSIIEPIRGVCPEGWHLPSNDEWSILFTSVGGADIAGSMLKSTSGWVNDCNGVDSFDFSVLPAGSRDYEGLFYSVGYYVYYWSSSQIDNLSAYNWDFYYNGAYAGKNNLGKNYAFPIRCVRD